MAHKRHKKKRLIVRYSLVLCLNLSLIAGIYVGKISHRDKTLDDIWKITSNEKNNTSGWIFN